jgi:hypothetical protein
MTADVVCVCGHAKLHHYIHLVGELGVCKADDCRCLQYVPQPPPSRKHSKRWKLHVI